MSRQILLLLPLLFAGCEERFPVYAKYCQPKTASLDCLRYDALMNATDQNQIAQTLELPHDPHCKNLLQLTRYHVGECNNPLVKSIGGDFDGYVRIQINRGMNCYYKAQSDFKNDEEAAYQRVLLQVQDDLKN